jgi:hypothetical protein
MTYTPHRLALACLALCSHGIAFANPLNIHVDTVISDIRAIPYPAVIPLPGAGGSGPLVPLGSELARNDAASHFQNGQKIALDITLDTSVVGERGFGTANYALTYTGALLRMQATIESTGETFNLGYWSNPSQTVTLLVDAQSNSGHLQFQGNTSGDAPVLVSDTQASSPALYLVAGTGMLPGFSLPVGGDGNYSLQGAENWLNHAWDNSTQSALFVGLSSDCHPAEYYCASALLTRTSLSVSSVPEASTWSLMALGLVGIAGVAASRRRTSLRA